MNNTLKKDITTQYVQGSPAVTGDPGTPGVLPPRTEGATGGVTFARDVTTTVTVCKWVQVDISRSAGLMSMYGAPYTSMYLCSPEIVTTRVSSPTYIPPRPGRPAVESQLIIDRNLGWNASSRSIAFVNGDLEAKFKAPAGVIGAVVGLNDFEEGSGYAGIDHGLYITSSAVQVVENGTIKGLAVMRSPGMEFKIIRRGPTVEYFAGGESIYTSVLPSENEVFLGASIYSGGDYVYDPSLKTLPVAGGRVRSKARPFVSLSSDRNYCSVEVEALPIIQVGLPDSAFVAALPFTTTMLRTNDARVSAQPFLGSSADRVYGAVFAKNSPFVSASEGGMIIPTYGIAENSNVPLTGVCTGLTGEIGGCDVISEMFDGYCADRPYGFSRTFARPFIAASYAYDGPTDASFFSGTNLRDKLLANADIYASVSSTGVIGSLFAVQLTQNGNVVSSAYFDTLFDVTATLSAAIFAEAQSYDLVANDDPVGEAWVVNTTTGANSRYDGFNFNSFAKIKGRYYGCRADGIHLLEGDSDNGAPIRSMISLGKQTFGTSLLKRVSNVYVGAASSGKLFLRVVVEGSEYTYSTRSSSEHIQGQRVDIGRGLRATYFEFELYNADGEDFELASVEFAAISTTRRI